MHQKYVSRLLFVIVHILQSTSSQSKYILQCTSRPCTYILQCTSSPCTYILQCTSSPCKYIFYRAQTVHVNIFYSAQAVNVNVFYSARAVHVNIFCSARAVHENRDLAVSLRLRGYRVDIKDCGDHTVDRKRGRGRHVFVENWTNYDHLRTCFVYGGGVMPGRRTGSVVG